MNMAKYGLSSLTWISPFSNADFGLLQKASDMGFDVFEICVEDFDALDDWAGLKKAAHDAQISVPLCGAFGPDRDVSADEADIRKNGVAYLKTLIDMASELEEPYVFGPMYSAVGKTRRLTPEQKAQQTKWALENIGECAAYAKPKGIMLGVEPLNRFETDFMNTADQAVEFVNALNMDNVGFYFDTFHMNIEEKSIPNALRKAGSRLIGLHSCGNDRGTPGEDESTNWQGIKKACEEISFEGPFVIESFTPDCIEMAKAASIWRNLAESPEVLARDGLKFLKSVFG